ncbi:MAG: LysR family transcriptional regulator [Pseudomonadota bacterium]
MFGLRDAEIVREIARAGGFRAAAEVLKVAPSAVSERISHLEETLGLVLFDRSRRGARLAPEGRRFLERANLLLDLRDSIAAELSAGEGMEGTLRIGVAETIVHSALPQLLERLREAAPKIRLELSVDVSEDLQRALTEDAIDIALLLRQWVPGGAPSQPIERVSLGWYAAPGLLPHRLGPLEPAAFLDVLAARDLAVITFARRTPPAREVLRLLTVPGAPAPVLHGSSSLATMTHLARAGFGIGTLPDRLVADEVAEGRLERIVPGPLLRLTPMEFELCYLAPSAAPFAAILAPPAIEP